MYAFSDINPGDLYLTIFPREPRSDEPNFARGEHQGVFLTLDDGQGVTVFANIHGGIRDSHQTNEYTHQYEFGKQISDQTDHIISKATHTNIQYFQQGTLLFEAHVVYVPGKFIRLDSFRHFSWNGDRDGFIDIHPTISTSHNMFRKMGERLEQIKTSFGYIVPSWQ